MESAWAQYGWFHADSVTELKTQNCGRVFFFNASSFRWRTSFFGLVHLWRPIAPVQNPTRPISPTFSIFSIFPLPHRKNIQTILIRPILKFDALPIAHFETYVLRFLKHLWKLAISLKLWVPANSEVGWSRTVAAKIGVFRPSIIFLAHFDPMNTPKCYTWLESYGSQRSDRLAPTQQSWTCRASDFW